MGTVAEKLAKLRETKAAIGQAVADMGGSVAEGTPFSGYADCIRNIPPVTALPSGVCTITVENPSPEMGTVTPGGYASKKMQVTVTATPNSGYKFNGWARYIGKVPNPTMISAQSYTFPVASDTRFVAMFAAS